MALDRNAIMQHLQQHLSTGLAVIVGSGLSCAEGLPGMGALEAHLATSDPVSLGLTSNAEWQELLLAIKADGLEGALLKAVVDEPLADFIRQQCAVCIKTPEAIAISEALSGTRTLRFKSLLPFLPSSERLAVITSNYDRLLELACEMAGYMVDTKSHGTYHAPFSSTLGTYSYCSRIEFVKGKRLIRKVEHKTVSLYKPHGSLDWTNFNGEPVRSAFDVDPAKAVIITPGQQKYKAGYEKPFDMQRSLANDAINRAAKLLIIGYGFNDSHLEVHLGAKIKSGTPTLIMAHTLTPGAKFHALRSTVWALEKDPSASSGTIVHAAGSQVKLTGEDIWDVNGFIKGAMGK